MGVKFRLIRRGRGFARRTWDRTASEALGEAIVAEIRRRAFSAGLDVNDRNFDAYTPEYAAEKGSKKVNLSASGALERSISVLRAEERAVEVGMTGAAAVYGRVVNATRTFLALSPAGRRRIAPTILRLSKQALERSRRKISRARGARR